MRLFLPIDTIGYLCYVLSLPGSDCILKMAHYSKNRSAPTIMGYGDQFSYVMVSWK